MEQKEIKNPVKAIREFCRECVGGYSYIEDCCGYTCKLYKFRSGKNPYRTPRVLTDEQRIVMAERLKKAREWRAE